MNLQNRLAQRPRVVRRTPSTQVLEQVKQGRRFIVVEDDFDRGFIPQGHTLITIKHNGTALRTLVPQSLLFYMVNPGEGDSNDALEQIADFYSEAGEFEDETIGDGGTNVQEANWTTLSRDNYQVYLTNRLVKTGKGRDEEGEPVPEFNADVIKQLDLEDPYVAQRVKVIAAVSLGKTIDQIDVHEVKDVLRHINHGTKRTKVTEELSKAEFEKITCWAGSHYEVRPEYRNKPDADYSVRKLHDRGFKSGTKTYMKETPMETAVLDRKVADLEGEIAAYRLQKHGTVGRHDAGLIRQYTNLVLIAPENPKSQLDIIPPKKEEPLKETGEAK